MSNETVTSTRTENTGNSFANALDFIVNTAIMKTVNVAVPVRVNAAYPGGTGPTGRVDVTPIVAQLDAANNALPRTTIYNVPYSRVQGGVAALVIDPEPGDIGIAVFAQQDISGVITDVQGSVQPGSFRVFDMADAMYIGGIVNKAPEIYLELTQEKVATLHAPTRVVINTAEAEINAEDFVTVNSPVTRFNGSVEVRDNLSWGREGTGLGGGRARITRGLDVEHGITNTGGSVSSNGIVLDSHVHGGVQTGGGSTGGPR